MTINEALQMTEDYIYMCEKQIEKTSGKYKEYWEMKLDYFKIVKESLVCEHI